LVLELQEGERVDKPELVMVYQSLLELIFGGASGATNKDLAGAADEQ
jgi:hypothetical protein